MTDNLLVGIAGVLLSLAFAYIPGLKDKYAQLSSQHKALVMLALVVGAALIVYAASCADAPWSPVECGEKGIWTLIELVLAALVGNQATYLVGVDPFRKG